MNNQKTDDRRQVTDVACAVRTILPGIVRIAHATLAIAAEKVAA